MREAYLSRAMDLCGDAVYALALCQLQSIEGAEQVYRSVFLELSRLPRGEQPGEDRTKLWLLRAAVETARDIDTQGAGPLHYDFVKVLQDRRNGELWNLVSRLPLRQRLVFHLTYGEDLGTAEIAEIIKAPEALVKTELSRARSTVRKERKTNVRIS